MVKYVIYTDGSYNKDHPNEVHGGICNDSDDKSTWLHVVSYNKEFTSMWNVGGEILAAYIAILSATNMVKESNEEKMDSYELELVYDYEGVGHWLTGRWRAKKPATQWFVREVKKLLDSTPNMKLKLTWTKGHSNNDGNNNADRVADWHMSFCRTNNIPICNTEEYVNL